MATGCSGSSSTDHPTVLGGGGLGSLGNRARGWRAGGVRSREGGWVCVSEGKAARLFVRCGGWRGSRAEHKSGHALSPCVSQTRGREVWASFSRARATSVFLEITQGSSFKSGFCAVAYPSFSALKLTLFGAIRHGVKFGATTDGTKSS